MTWINSKKRTNKIFIFFVKKTQFAYENYFKSSLENFQKFTPF